MLQSKMKMRKVSKPMISKNDYNEDIKEYIFVKDVDIALCYKSDYRYANSNDMDILSFDYLGFTSDRGLEEGMLLDDKYEIVGVNNEFPLTQLKLKVVKYVR